MSEIIRINNFRSFANLEIPIRPLTFLFGPNGSGKSSFIKAMKFINKNLFPLEMSKPVKYNIDCNLDLGSFKELVRGNDKDRKIEIEIEFFTGRFEKYTMADWGIPKNDSKEGGFEYILDKETFTFKSLTTADIGEKYRNSLDSKYIFKMIIDNSNLISLKIYSPNNGITATFELLEKEKEIDTTINMTWKEAQMKLVMPDKNINSMFEEFSLSSPFSNMPNYSKLLREFIYKNLQGKSEWDQYFPNEKEKIYHYLLCVLDDIYENVPESLSHIFSSFHYGSTRVIPKHRYDINSLSRELKNKLIYDYEDLLNLYIIQKPGGLAGISNLLDRLSKTLIELELAKKLEIIEEESNLYFQVHSFDGTKYNLAEASSGLLQILPILIGTSSNKEVGYSYYIEQPELHLHPKLQASLIQVLNNNRKSQWNSMGSASFIIETHSEHMIRKVQVMVARGELNSSDVGIYYFDKDNKKGVTAIKEMMLEDNGFFKEPWPNGFFDDSYNLTKELLFAKNN